MSPASAQGGQAWQKISADFYGHKKTNYESS